jgi:D-alanyl-lipoteichoic acid acyltransferase DltB (MBOAT superfamily)
MDFNSFTYLFFLIIVVTLYWGLQKNLYRQILLFGMSLVFYAFWRVEYIILLLVVAGFNYTMSYLIIKRKTWSKSLLFITLIIDILVLVYYKYIDFLLNSVYGIYQLFNIEVSEIYIDVLLPIGISFYTFQAMSYVIDVYRDKIHYTDKPLLYFNYIIFWPQMVAGPIIRASEIVYQLSEKIQFDGKYISRGVFYITTGLILKLTMADNIAGFVDDGFNTNLQRLTFLDAWTLSFAFGFQIYFDFAGYSMIAIGSAYLFGYDLPKNFLFPYMATNVRDFWKRWHITLSAWIRDYLYIPLTGQSFSKEKSKSGIEISNSHETFALFATWAIMGLWHGANWGFLFWGLYHAILIYIYRVFKKMTKIQLPIIISWSITIVFVMGGWIFFRVDNVGDALIIYNKMFNIFDISFHLGFRENFYLVTFLYLVSIVLCYQIYLYKEIIMKNQIVYLGLLYLYYTLAFFWIIIEMKQVKQFIYFQF